MATWEIPVGLLAGAAASYTDLRWRIIPNKLTYSLILVAVGGRFYESGLAGGMDAVAAGLLAGFLYAVVASRGAVGGGDVKLMAGLGSLVGMQQVLQLVLASSLATVLVYVAYQLRRGRIRYLWSDMRDANRRYRVLAEEQKPPTDVLAAMKDHPAVIPMAVASLLGYLYVAVLAAR